MRIFQAFTAWRSTAGTTRYRSMRQLLQKRKNELRMAVIFLVLIFLPGGLLAYMSWRAIKNEKLLAEQRVMESYGEFVRLAANEINDELKTVQAGLQAHVEKALECLGPPPDLELLDSLVKRDALVSWSTLLPGPGKIAYPFELERKDEDHPVRSWQKQWLARDYELYHDLTARGEKLEYRLNEFDNAIAVYKRLLTETFAPQIHAMAHSLIGRAQTKKEDWERALQTYEKLLRDYPEMRDVNKVHLRFLAQYQIAVCLVNLERKSEALAVLLRMNQDLLERSDTINMLQYSQFEDLINALLPTVLAASKLSEAEYYQKQFESLANEKKKHLSHEYFVHLFDDELHELVIEGKSYRPTIRYFSGQADNRPFLLGYRALPDGSGFNVAGLFGIHVNLTRLRKRIFPAILPRLKTSEAVILAILDNDGNYVIGTRRPQTAPVATHVLDSPFQFWQVGVFLVEDRFSSTLSDFSNLLWLWLIALLLFSILLGAYLFIRSARHEAHLSELKSTFVSRVSHELRTPVTSIKMLAEHLDLQSRQTDSNRDGEFRNRSTQYLSVICRESDRLGRLIENILNFSKIERGVKEYAFEYEMPAVVLHKAIASFRPHAEAQGFIMKTKIDDDLPELLLDADSITEALLNLLGNAVKYSEKEKIIEVRAFRNYDRVCIEVEDRGIGISADQTASIFDEFYRIDQKLNSRQQAGVGLGLTLVKHIVQAHGGTIAVRSVKDQGSIFIMTLPIPPEESLPAEAASESSTAKNNQPVASVV